MSYIHKIQMFISDVVWDHRS